jgi:hydroxymethylpyrimidine pyrophosphatase-like HAD family hydrolase
VVCFGDSANDIPMFAAADRAYAVANALPEVAAAADAVIDAHDVDAVAEFLRADWRRAADPAGFGGPANP